MKLTLTIVVAICLVASLAAAQQVVITARSLGMGNTGVAVADDAAAWAQNPAGLGMLGFVPQDDHRWAGDVMATYGSADSRYNDQSFWNATWSGWDPEEEEGIGFGVGDFEDDLTAGGVGWGRLIRRACPLYFGANAFFVNPVHAESDIIVNAGFLYPVRRGRIGLRVDDVFAQWGDNPMLDVGAFWSLGSRLNVAVDVLDLTDESNDGPFVNGGLEYALNQQFKLRAGATDSGDGHDFTAGVGCQLGGVKLDFGYGDFEDGVWALSASKSY